MQTRRQGAKAKAPMKKTCELDDTPDEDARSYDGDKENEVNAVKPGRKSKREDGTRAGNGKKRLSKRQKVDKSAGNAVSQESPPIFIFNTSKTSFRKRRQLKLERQHDDDEKNKKRIEDLVTYFKNLDKQKLETV
ncbi:hypothetical protein, variant 1 [Phytophthora nicotianae CJ01A1]|uniref:Uncharacterized protein n=5 Tax=Phytophthora nicotianae TaxID=4792 RepID=V9EHZ0_PHYNI|nr:hypothetical protein PPTG_16029 [Phytophthora nicotianae INRA-310]XP_008911531.1 hypothetical protein, variant 1 [Phytophthora nicotianae INRA-310]ETI37677.1 hypothetical protein F443_16411 [Phytophthora nicotianae P1569]ETK77942.1 hypothetical protein L915_15949 [Phytophthora nicotianae]ETO66471.1 hypothetical protein F444_16380 [Phytophthora nicotianae P1976]ETP07585.1 hypothetical protein F441_16240 [Phytophthora nicotianae CJ01A1]ETI37678.1 hypothetical protein, variant 1 [Phytophthora